MTAVMGVARFTVEGRPIPQGSKTVFMVKGRPVLADANSKDLKPWRLKVAAVAKTENVTPILRERAVAVYAVFTFERPKTVKREYPTVKPDIDKLIRSVLDAVTASGMWADDCQVVDLRVVKRYGAVPGVEVQVGVINEEEQ